MCYNAGMGTSEWIILFLAIPTLIFVGLYFRLRRSLQRTREIQEKQYRLTLLNEIVDWAIDAKTVSWEVTMAGGLPATDRVREHENVERMLDKYKTSNARSEYISGIALKFGGNLSLNTDTVVEKLNEIMQLLVKYLKSQAKPRILKKCGIELNEKASDLIIEAMVVKNVELGLS